MALLDADMAGCVSVWLNNGGALDTERLGILRDCIADLEQILPMLNEPEGPRYYQRLHQPALFVSTVEEPNPSSEESSKSCSGAGRW